MVPGVIAVVSEEGLIGCKTCGIRGEAVKRGVGGETAEQI